jgi:hypothetical protein
MRENNNILASFHECPSIFQLGKDNGKLFGISHHLLKCP